MQFNNDIPVGQYSIWFDLLHNLSYFFVLFFHHSTCKYTALVSRFSPFNLHPWFYVLMVRKAPSIVESIYSCIEHKGNWICISNTFIYPNHFRLQNSNFNTWYSINVYIISMCLRNIVHHIIHWKYTKFSILKPENHLERNIRNVWKLDSGISEFPIMKKTNIKLKDYGIKTTRRGINVTLDISWSKNPLV